MHSRSRPKRVVAERPPGPYAECAERYTGHGLCVIPVGDAEDSKRPQLLGWNRYKRPLGKTTLAGFIERFGGQNIGMLCGEASGVVVVDLDDPSLYDMAIKRFGETDVQVRTPSGGWHLYYSYRGEKNCDLRHSEGLAIEIKSDGTQVLMPPSVGDNGKHYVWAGDFGVEGIDLLPRMNATQAEANQPGPSLAQVKEGQRNDTLFRRALRLARNAPSEADLLTLLEAENNRFEEPLSEIEVRKVATSAWSYEIDGRNRVGSDGVQQIDKEMLVQFGGHGDAYLLWTHLQFHHGPRNRRGEPFALATAPMADNNVIDGWGRQRYMSAIRALRELGLLELVHSGGRGPGDPSLYRFCSKGAPSEHNATNTPPRGEVRDG